jgi:predicted DNA-binding transcriptional regulator AlpA
MAETNGKSQQDQIGSARLFDQLPNSAHVRLDVVRILYACSSATVWRRVSEGLIPKPVKLGPNITAWSVAELRRDLAEKQSGREA